MHANLTAPAYTVNNPDIADLWEGYKLWSSLAGGSGFHPDQRRAEFSSTQDGRARQSARNFKNAFPSWYVSLDGWQFLA